MHLQSKGAEGICVAGGSQLVRGGRGGAFSGVALCGFEAQDSTCRRSLTWDSPEVATQASYHGPGAHSALRHGLPVIVPIS